VDWSVALQFLGGFALLVIGANMLIHGASRIAAALGVSPLVIGLTVVAFGTSAPELAVSVRAALGGNADVALGNVVGSNTFNVLFILGVSALLVPLAIVPRLLWFDVPILIGVSALAWWLASDGAVSRWEGALLVAGIAGYTLLQIETSRRARSTVPRPAAARSLLAVLWNLLLVAGGLALLVLGADWLVQAAVAIARALGVSDLVIALTIVAAGTSLPEVAASVVAALKRERDIAVGNVVGSNIFNLLCVLGVSAAVAPEGVRVPPAALALDIPVMFGVAAVCLPVFWIGRRVSRAEGALLLLGYCAYVAVLIARER
jgi:cation:H+ antiporter